MPPAQPVELAGDVGQSHGFTTIPAQRGEVLTIDLKPTFVSLGLPRSAFATELQGTASGKIFDAAVGGGTTFPGVLWVFMGADYVRLDLRSDTLTGPATIAGNWGSRQWPPTFASGIDAAATLSNQPGFAWFFKGGQYIRYDLRTDVVAGPADIAANWSGWPASFLSGIDAAAQGQGASEGMGYFFKGSEYIRYNNAADVRAVDVGPSSIASAWPGWPESFDHVDAAISGIGAESHIIYFVRGEEFIAYDLAQEKVISSPKHVASKWPKLSPFMRRPQIFLVESMQLTTYYGDTMSGPLLSSQSLRAGGEETYTVIVRRSATDTIAETTTVLESQDQALVDDVNRSMREDEASGRASDRYDYKFDSSFEGELEYSGLGGSVDAALSFQGSSTDVRESASKAAMNAVQKQVSRTERNRRQSTQVVGGTHEAANQFESTFTQTVHNPTSSAVSVGLYQLVQEYVAFTVISDVRVAFSNGGAPDMAPLERLDLLLSRCVADAAQAEIIRNALLEELRKVLDYKHRPVSLVKVTDGRAGIDPEVTSTFTLLNPDHTPRRDIIINGAIVRAETFRQLTQASLLKELEVQ
jgi:hypothetical protein